VTTRRRRLRARGDGRLFASHVFNARARTEGCWLELQAPRVSDQLRSEGPITMS